MSLRLLSAAKRSIPGPVRRALSGFWAVPTMLGALGGAAAVGLQYAPQGWFSAMLADGVADFDTDGARAVLSVVATSVMSVVSIVLSLTFVAMSLTAQQLSPRMLDFVLRERAVQLLLGLALATFVFASVSLSFGEGEAVWRLFLAAPSALALAAATLIAIIVFIHRMTLVMRPDEMVAQRAAAFVAAAKASKTPPEGCAGADRDAEAALRRALAGAEPLRAPQAGYVGAIDYPAMAHLAAETEGRLALTVRENDFLTPGEPYGRAQGFDEPAVGKVLASLDLTDRREVASGCIYEAHALSEGAIRALSPGINDPGTAFSCIDRLFEGAFALAAAPPPAALGRPDEPPRVLRAVFGVDELLREAILPILHYARDDPRIPERVADHARSLAPRLSRENERAALAELERRLEA